MGRAPCCDKASVKRGPWSPEEDAKLKAYIEKNGTGGNWIALPQKIGLKRCGKSCRLRWLNYLRPNIKHGGFSEEEDNIICSLYLTIGSRWSVIAAQLPGRTDNDIKNYWNTRLKKKLLGKQRKNQRTRSVSCVKQEIKSESERILAMETINIFPQFQQPEVLPAVVPFQEGLFYGGNRLSDVIIDSSLHPRDVFYIEEQPRQTSLDMSATSTSLNSLSKTSSPLPSIYCPLNGVVATSFQQYNNFSSGFDGTDYNHPQQIWDGLESFSGVDMVNRSTITNTSPESTSFEDISSIVCSPAVFNYEISRQAIPQDCTFQESRQLEMQQQQYCTSMI